MICVERGNVPDRWELANLMLLELEMFSELNELDFKRSKIKFIDRHDPIMYGCFYPTPGKIEIYMKEVKDPSYKTGHWPCHVTDCTVAGVVAHEFGHWIVDNFGISMRNLEIHPSGFSNANSNKEERMAEAFRLFLLNPSLLKAGKPEYWNFFTKNLNLKPLHNSHWRDILANSYSRYIRSSEKWIERNRKLNENRTS